MLAEYFDEPEDSAMNKVEQFEKDVKKRFIEQPGQMKLLIVVDKLLTGFDAPPATYLYIDKKMQDHGLFQAICRVNRLDSEDKEYGYIIDYKDLFKSLERSIHDYTGEAFEAYDAEDVQGLLADRLTKSRERLEELRESVKALCEPVAAPKDTVNYVQYFCGKSGDGDELEDNEQKRVALYKTVAALLRAYADLANEMSAAGYTEKEAHAIKEEVAHYEKVREEIKLASADYVDMKVFEPAMRHLLDSYIKADESKKLSAFDDMTLVQLIVEQGEHAIAALPEGLRKDPEAMAEAIENNVRRLIIDESPVNPKYYEKMSELLEALIKERKAQALHYTAYLQKVAELAKKVQRPESSTVYPTAINTGALRALYDNLDRDEDLAMRVDEVVRNVKKDGFRGNRFKEREIRGALRSVLGSDDGLVDRVFDLVKAQREY
jgi:type I restriction enzyme R subunit